MVKKNKALKEKFEEINKKNLNETTINQEKLLKEKEEILKNLNEVTKSNATLKERFEQSQVIFYIIN